MTVVQVTPTSGPASEETEDLVEALRDRPTSSRPRPASTAYVTGTTALNIDTVGPARRRRCPRYVAVVVGLALLLLMVGVPLDPGAAQGGRRASC